MIKQTKCTWGEKNRDYLCNYCQTTLQEGYIRKKLHTRAKKIDQLITNKVSYSIWKLCFLQKNIIFFQFTIFCQSMFPYQMLVFSVIGKAMIWLPAPWDSYNLITSHVGALWNDCTGDYNTRIFRALIRILIFFLSMWIATSTIQRY